MIILAIDFDGTCVEHKYPEIGPDIPNAVEVLRNLTEDGVQLILYTMRSGRYLQDAIQWFANRQIPLYGINENPTQKTWTSSPKVYAHYYIDDAAVGCPLIYPKEGRPYVDWDMVAIKLDTLLHKESNHS